MAADVYARATNQFAAAIFLKPAGATNADLISELAPLIMQQVAEQEPSPDSLRRAPLDPGFAADIPASGPTGQYSPLLSGHGLTREEPAVYYMADRVQLNGHAHMRFAYQWFYPARNPAGVAGGFPAQGVRITFNSAGQPAVWEVLADTSGRRLMFVSQSLERAAAAEFGKPLPGRRYAVERSVEQAPEVLVPRVIDDGPVPMGPIVYLNQGTRNVSTLICRCMPAQVKRLVATRMFELLPLDNAALVLSGTTASNAPPVLWHSGSPAPKGIGQWLRLPSDF